jgi:hypothetical protein
MRSAQRLDSLSRDHDGAQAVGVPLRPDLRQLLRDGRERIPEFIEETMRLQSPIQREFRLSLFSKQLHLEFTPILWKSSRTMGDERRDVG